MKNSTKKRQAKLLELMNDYSGFIRDGYKFVKKKGFDWRDYKWRYYDYGNYDNNDYYGDDIDDAEHRFDLIIPRLKLEIQDNGELEKITSFLKSLTLPKNVDLKQSNFKDLTLKTAFVKNKNYLRSLIDEIKQDVFDNQGDIKVNMVLKPFRELAGEYWFVFRNFKQPFENIVYFPYPAYTEEDIRNYFRRRPIPGPTSGEILNLDFITSVLARRAKANGRSETEILPCGNYVGMLENGKNEIRVIAQKTDYSNDGTFFYWDTFIDDIIPTLRTAIEWFTRKPEPIRYTKEELEALNGLDKDTRWMDEARDVFSDMEADGYLDDD